MPCIVPALDTGSKVPMVLSVALPLMVGLSSCASDVSTSHFPTPTTSADLDAPEGGPIGSGGIAPGGVIGFGKIAPPPFSPPGGIIGNWR